MDSIRRQFEKEATQTIADFEAYSKKAREEYEKYEAQARADYSRYTRSIKQTWGGEDVYKRQSCGLGRHEKSDSIG